MAILIHKSGQLDNIELESETFTIDIMEKIILGHPTPMKKGLYWVISNDEIQKIPENLNIYATNYFNINLYGDILVTTAMELPLEWDIATEDDKFYKPGELDDILVHELIYLAYEEGISLANEQMKEDIIIYEYNPYKTDIDNREETNLLINAHKYLKECAPEFNDFVIYKDKTQIIKVKEFDLRIKTLEQILDVCVKNENYETANIIKNWKETLIKQENTKI